MRARRPISFGVVTAPTFEIVAEGSQVTPSELPFASAEIELADAPSHALSFNLTRRQQRDSDDEDLEYIVAQALTLGLARVIDRVVLQAMVAASPATFTIAKAASRGLKAAELSAMCGTSGNGATFGADGAFRVGGVRAEMTDTVAPSIVGAFGRVGVACDDEFHLIVKRTSLVGDLEITCFANFEALMPTGDQDFWVAAA